MGRGRSKAKQTKVARDLKYSTEEMDLEKLATELHGDAKPDSENQAADAYSEDKNPLL